jgi:chemotaxis signal transduction protein
VEISPGAFPKIREAGSVVARVARAPRFSQSSAVQFTMSGSMKETAHDETKATRSTGAERSDDATRRRLFVMRSGARLFAVYADEVEATSENVTPAPLPFAPPPVRGVVSQRGRILTLIDPLPLLPGVASTAAPPAATTKHAPFVVALKGDEQLALSVEAVEREVELYDTETDAAARPSGTSLLRRTIPYDTHAVALIDPARLFDAAMQGVERRRQRT